MQKKIFDQILHQVDCIEFCQRKYELKSIASLSKKITQKSKIIDFEYFFGSEMVDC